MTGFFQLKICEKHRHSDYSLKKFFIPIYPDLELHKLILQFDAVIASFLKGVIQIDIKNN